MTTAPCFSSLPQEIQLVIGKFLSQHDLALCTRVCKQLKALYNPLVWRHISSNEWRDGLWEKAFLQSIKTGSLSTHAHHIQSLHLEFYNSDIIHQFLDHSPPAYPHLTSIEISDVEQGDELIFRLIKCTSAGLKRFVIHKEAGGYVSFGNWSTSVLLEHAATLEVVQMDGAVFFESTDIQRLLCSAPNLRKFSLLGIGRPEEMGDGHIEARDMVMSEWVCTNLEVFECEIGGIPRPDITRNPYDGSAEDYILEGTREESLDLQRKVYAQLGKLTKLRKLALGSPQVNDRLNKAYMDYDRLFDCLAMTLDSGLDLLKDLKELKSVYLDNMEVYVDRCELEWVKENWPKLKTISYEVIDEVVEE
jgi:hypothetical protein